MSLYKVIKGEKNSLMKLIRAMNYFHEKKYKLLAGLIMRFVRIIYSCDIPPGVQIGKKVIFKHNGLGVVIHPASIIGDYTQIYQNVSIAGRHQRGVPQIGVNVFIGAGACILGGIKIGKNVIIGANCVVLSDIPDNAVVAGVPGKIIKFQHEIQHSFSKKEKKILVVYDSISFFMPYMQSEKVDTVRLYKKKGLLLTIIKKVFLYFGWFSKLWYEDWVNSVQQYDKVIFFASKDYVILRFIKNKGLRIIFWYWNPAFRMGIPKNELYNLTEIWSFDPEDCKTFDLKFNTTFYFKDIFLPKNNIVYDTIFLGINKSRRLYLNKLELLLNKNGVSSFFYIIPDKNENAIYPLKPMPYKEYLIYVSKTKALIDISPVGQTGLTVRVMESIFFKKKLITDDKTMKLQPFYKRENIFILEEDNEIQLKSFIDSPYVPLDPSIIDSYDFLNWLKRFEIS